MRILGWYRLTLGVLWVVTPARVLVYKQVEISDALCRCSYLTCANSSVSKDQGAELL